MARWYRAQDGVTSGPYEFEEIRRGLKEGTIFPLDLLFHEGDSSWRLARAVPELQNIFAQPPTSGSAETFAWVVLRYNGRGYDQEGPFSVLQLRERLAAGELEYSQYAWKVGYDRWLKLSSIPDVNSDWEYEPIVATNSTPKISTENVLDHVVQLNRHSDGVDFNDFGEIEFYQMPYIGNGNKTEPESAPDAASNKASVKASESVSEKQVLQAKTMVRATSLKLSWQGRLIFACITAFLALAALILIKMHAFHF
jgi:hypothetical protein